MINLIGKYTNAQVMLDSLDQECISQVESLINNPAFTNPVCIMPDAHKGKGSVIGFTMKLSDKVIPNVIGVDIGCGMLSVNIGRTLPDSFEKIDKVIRGNVPLGHQHLSKQHVKTIDYNSPNKTVVEFVRKYNRQNNTNYTATQFDDEWLNNKIKVLGADQGTFYKSIGTLGGGNHFIEIGEGKQDYYLTIHSGSRNFGLKVAQYWQSKAAENFSRNNGELEKEVDLILKNTKEKKSANKKIRKLKRKVSGGKNRELAYLNGNDMIAYLTDMVFAQYYASLNRQLIFEQIADLLKLKTFHSIESVHNYIDFRDMMIRKGAISSYEHEEMIIPLNMRDGILLCTGRSNSEWNYSAPHGAGRVLSRSKAKQQIRIEDFKSSMKDIYSTSISKSTLDESPFAYKNSKMIEKAIAPTADIIEKIKPVYNLKA